MNEHRETITSGHNMKLHMSLHSSCGNPYANPSKTKQTTGQTGEKDMEPHPELRGYSQLRTVGSLASIRSTML